MEKQVILETYEHLEITEPDVEQDGEMPEVPTEEEFAIVLKALDAYEAQGLTQIVVEHALENTAGLSDEKAFVKAFTKGVEKPIHDACLVKAKKLQETMKRVISKFAAQRDFLYS